MEERNNVPQVVVEAPEGVTVEVIYGELKAEEKELIVEEAPVEEAPAEEAAPVEEAEAPKEEAPKRAVESEPERIYASEEEVEARIAELEAANEELRQESERLDAELDDLYKAKRKELYEECKESVRSALVIADTYNSIDVEFKSDVVEFNRSYGELDYLLAYLKSKKEAR